MANDLPSSPPSPPPDLPAHEFEGARRRAMTLALDASPAQRIEWLEEMLALAHASGALPRVRA